MKKTVKKVPVILQMESLECGAASLAMVLAYYKRFIPLEQLRIDCNVSRDGSSAKYITLAAKHHGLNAKAFRMSAERIQNRTDFPMIIHWNFNHFVVLCGFQKDGAVINDPAGGRELIPLEEFCRSFTGIAMTFQPSEQFEPYGEPSRGVAGVCQRLRGNGAILVFVLTMGMILSILELTKPAFYKVFTDEILLGGSNQKIYHLLLVMSVVLVLSFFAGLLRHLFLAKLQTKMSIDGSASFFWHVLHLPVSFFAQRYTGDVASRLDSNIEIARVLCTELAPVVLDVIMIGLYLIVMFCYSVPMALMGIGMAVVNLLVVFLASKQNKNEIKNVQRDEGKLSGVQISAISMMETIKASGAEDGIFERLAGYQAKYNNSVLKLKKRNVLLSILPQVISGLTSGAILLIGVYSVFNGNLTIGALMAFQSLMALFLTPVGNLANSVQSMQTLSGTIQRLDDVEHYPVDRKAVDTQTTEYCKLSGKVELEHLSFAYSRLAPELIHDFCLNAEPGEMVALVGGSGSGKSTIAKLVSGLYTPRSGRILLDGKPIDEIDPYILTGSLAVVDQSIALFGGTIRENITMWDDSVSQDVVIAACRDACIHDEIMQLKDGYDAVIAEGGNNFSGGQRQRIEIARAFAAQPSILIMDEATSALDPMTEKRVMDAVKRRKITCLVIAHRLSTIRDADEIIMLEAGEIVERGTHGELIAKNGKYKALVSSE